jgi:hypothetical protein
MTTSGKLPPSAASGTESLHEWTPDDPVESPEHTVLEHALAGTRLDLARDGTVDHQAMGDWGPTRTVRAAVLRHLLLAPQWPVHSKEVRLRGVRISGQLDLESGTVRCPLLLEDCYLESPEPVVLDNATASQIVLSRCRVVGGLTARLLVVTKDLDLEGSLFESVVRLSGADITGQLTCRNAEFTGTDGNGNALVGERMKVGGNMTLDQATVAGGVWLSGADITGPLSCHNAKLTGSNRDGYALVGEQMEVGGGVLLEYGFAAAGAIRLVSASIADQLSCRDAKLTGIDGDGDALVGDRMKVGGSVFLDEGFTATGAIRLSGADITGQLTCRNTKLTGSNSDGYALIGEGLKVGGAVLLDQGFAAAGAVGLFGADITGPLSCRNSEITVTDGKGNALVHLARNGRMAAAPGTPPPALHPDHRRARWEGQTEVAVDPSGVGRFPKAFGAKLAHQPGSTGVGRGTRRPAWFAPVLTAPPGLAAQPVPQRPRRSRARLPARRTAGQRYHKGNQMG